MGSTRTFHAKLGKASAEPIWPGKSPWEDLVFALRAQKPKLKGIGEACGIGRDSTTTNPKGGNPEGYALPQGGTHFRVTPAPRIPLMGLCESAVHKSFCLTSMVFARPRRKNQVR